MSRLTELNFQVGQVIKLTFAERLICYVHLVSEEQASNLETDIQTKQTAWHTVEGEYAGEYSQVYLNFAMLVSAYVYSSTEM